ncbi:protein NRT1/ PTR FAMILY 5.6-like [Lycium ferocissimum]|uniref:protein NRT1/ PTR FAMILY 5.6-like n=1 Tax=Lycium ferocissimum TaxID=112874 RepID=UPI002814BEED|nr:protein NRT1/ PTR FAMILY 5.6-like [Lycium ferocissimum]
MLAMLINHLTDDREVTLPKAAQIVNVHEGLTSLLVIVVAQLSDSYFGRLKLILFTNTAFIFGLMMLWYESHRLSIKALFGALALLTLGKAGRDVTLKAFLADQLRISGEEPNLEEEELIEARRKLIWRFCWILGIIMATVWLSNEKWEALAKKSTIAMAAGFFVFLPGIPFYKHEDTFPSPILNAFNVVKAAVLKGHLNYPTSPDQLFKNYSKSATEILPHIAFLRVCFDLFDLKQQNELHIPVVFRWLDKAAILEPSPSCPVSTEQVESGRLFEVAKVKDVKRLISMFPLWSTFYVYSLVGATANTFFYEQANYINDHLGEISRVPIVVFVIIMTFTSSITSIICSWFKDRSTNARRPPLNRIRFGMFFSIICCAVACGVEVHRLHRVKVEDNQISIFWLTPQFLLVGLMEGLSESGLQDFFETQVCESMKEYGPQFSEFSDGIGKFFSVICILIFHFWFDEDVDTSRLDKYYAMLTVPTFLNFVFCCIVSNWYANQPHGQSETDDNAQELQDGVADDNAQELQDGFADDNAQELQDGVAEDNAQELQDGVANENSGFEEN